MFGRARGLPSPVSRGRPTTRRGSGVWGTAPILRDAEVLLRASSYSGSGAWVDGSGNGHDATLGSAVTFRDPTAEVLAEYPGLESERSTCPDAADLDAMTGGFVVLFDVRPDATTFNGMIVGKPMDAVLENTNDSWAVMRSNSASENRTVSFEYEDTVNGHTGSDSFTLGTFTEGERWELCVEFIADDGAGGFTGNIYAVDGGTDATTPDGEGLTLIESVTTAHAGGAGKAITPSNEPLGIGEAWDGGVARVRVYDSMGGSLLRDFYPARDGVDRATTFTSAGPVGETWTLASALSKPSRHEFRTATGNDGFLSVAHDAAIDFDATSESFTVMAVATSAAPGDGAFHGVVTKFAGAAGWNLGHYTALGGTYAMLVNGGAVTAIDAVTAIADNTRAVLALRHDHTADELELFVDGTGTGSPADTSAVTDTSNATALTIGGAAAFGGGQVADIEAVAVWSRALTDAEIAVAGAQL